MPAEKAGPGRTQDSRRRAASLRFVGNAVFHRQSPEEFEWRVERKLVGRGGGDEAGDEWEEAPEGGVRRKKSVKTKRKLRASDVRAK